MLNGKQVQELLEDKKATVEIAKVVNNSGLVSIGIFRSSEETFAFPVETSTVEKSLEKWAWMWVKGFSSIEEENIAIYDEVAKNL